jgi:hypothetical protein
MFRDFGRVTFDDPYRESYFSYSYRRLRGKLGLEEGAPGLLQNSLIKTAASKRSQTKSKRRSKRVDDIEKLTQDEVGEPYQVIKVVEPSL